MFQQLLQLLVFHTEQKPLFEALLMIFWH